MEASAATVNPAAQAITGNASAPAELQGSTVYDKGHPIDVVEEHSQGFNRMFNIDNQTSQTMAVVYGTNGGTPMSERHVQEATMGYDSYSGAYSEPM